jgi:MFS family permease
MSSSAHQSPTPPGVTAATTAHDHGSKSRIAPEEIAVGVVVGRASEYFDFFVFGIAAVLVFPHVFFPFADSLHGLLYAFAIFSLAFISRPFGTALFMNAQRRWGRSVKLTAALFVLGTATAGMAFLPGYSVLGDRAIWLLAFFRLVQGIGFGGSWDGLPSLLAMNAPPQRRGWYSMMGQLGAPIGFIIAASLFLFLHWSLESDDFLTWGWRYPFYVAFAVNVVALFARLRLVVTHEYTEMLEEGQLEPISTREMVRSQGYNIFLGAFAALASYALFHLVTVFPLSWIALQNSQDLNNVRCGDRHRMHRHFRAHCRPYRPAHHTGPFRHLHRCVRALRPVSHGRRLNAAGYFHPGWLRAARAVVRAGRRYGDVELRATLSLHWGGADDRLRVAVRRGLRAARGAGIVVRVRTDCRECLSALGHGVHAAGIAHQQGLRDARLIAGAAPASHLP